MSNDEVRPDLNEILTEMGEAGLRLTAIDACEGAAGNISVYCAYPLEVEARFPRVEVVELPVAIPELAGGTIIGTGSGRRLREILDDPEGNLGCLMVEPGGRTARLYTSARRRFARLTSELNSHLGVQADQVSRRGLAFHALIHAQPPHITFLSQVRRYQDSLALSRRLVRWEPETILNFPEGFGYLPFAVPGTEALLNANVEALRRHKLVIWAKHGLMARSDKSVKNAADLIDYAEAAARYEYMNLLAGEAGQGLSDEEVLAILRNFGVESKLFG